MKTFISNAKINLGLKILNKRPDNYHNIHSYFIEINLSDELIFSPNENHYLSIIGNYPNQFPIDKNNLITKNLSNICMINEYFSSLTSTIAANNS